ncbi:MAG: GGDEF domain-containing protein [Nitrospirae bacterium]|nr:GGDEF domain-containing protein [Nitrospirota bacterium]
MRKSLTFDGIPEHGHYCVPIIMKDKVLGVLNVDVNAGHKKDKIEEQLLLMFSDTLASIIERKKADEKLEYMANYDALTGVPNRTLLFDRLAQSIYQSKRYNDRTAVIYIDLDKFKPINDKYGHDAGDVVLKKTTNRLRRCIRDTDTLSRLGGDEFTIVARGFKSLNDLTELCNRMVAEVCKPIEHKGHVFSVNASIGVSIYPEDGGDAMLLLKKADTAMYSAKMSSGSKFLFYKDSMDKNLSERDKLEEDIRHAISTNQFVLHYQPQIDLTTNKITGVEALIRWNHPIFGMIYPDKFIPLAEEVGLIIDIGKWVLKTACEQNILWHEEGLPLLNMAVNVASNEFQQHDFVDNVIHILSDTQMNPIYLELEITERISIHDIETTITVLSKLNNAGVKVSLDDFGTGYSSLSYLKRLPFNKIKIDKSFVMDIQHNQDALIIAKTIIDMSHNLKKVVIAEGIETAEQLEMLKSLNCDEGQGYLFSKAVSAEDFMRFAKDKVLYGL